MAFIEINAGLYANPEHVEWVADADKHPSISQGQAPEGSSIISVGGFVFVVEEPASSLALRVRDGQRGTHRIPPQPRRGEPKSEAREPAGGEPTPDAHERPSPEQPIPDEDAFASEVAAMEQEDRMTVMSILERVYHAGGSPEGKDRVAIKKMLQREQPPNVRHFLNAMLSR